MGYIYCYMAVCVILVLDCTSPHPLYNVDKIDKRGYGLLKKIEQYIEMKKRHGVMQDTSHTHVIVPNSKNMQDKKHGIVMGVPYTPCDDGENGTKVDYDPVYIQCNTNVTLDYTSDPKNITQVKLDAGHVCLNETIDYGTPLPLNGDHRPLWPKFGEYSFLPPQRWVHSLEHGAVVLLYHPCVPDDVGQNNQLKEMKKLLQSCMTKHMIAPYSMIPENRPYVLLAYRHARLLSSADLDQTKDFIQNFGLKGPETKILTEGQYDEYMTSDVLPQITNTKTCVSD